MTGHEKIAAGNIKGAFNYIVGGYINNIYDGYEDSIPSSREELVEEIYSSAFTDLYSQGSIFYGKAPKEMKFAGTEFCRAYLEKLIDTDEEVKEIAEVANWNDKEEEKEMMNVIEKKTGMETTAVALENGKYEVNGKTYAASTFKKYYKVVKAQEAKKPEKPQAVEVELYTFTNMRIQGTFTAELVGNEYHINTKKKGLLTFNAETLIQTNCKNAKYANKITIL